MRQRETRRWSLPAFVLLAWLALGAVAGGYPGRLDEVQQNDGVSFLPAAAEATEVARLQERLAGGKIQPAVVVIGRDAGLTEADRRAVAVARAGVSALPGLAGPVSDPVPSPDGKAVLFVVPVTATDGFEAGRTAQRVRDVVRAAGLDAHVTGPAGFTADLAEVFSGIDGPLLAVTAAFVAVVLVFVHRSVLLPVVVLASAVLALIAASWIVYPLAAGGVLGFTGQSQGILYILVFGAATDYALLLIARYREELAARPDRWAAMAAAMRASLASIVASAGTVVLGLLCLLFSGLSSNRGLGPVAAIGIVTALSASVTFLPAALVVLGRKAFWPARPRAGHAFWDRVAAMVGRRSRPIWILTALVLAGLAACAPMLRADGVGQSDVFLHRADSVAGRDVLAAHFPGRERGPVVVIAKRAADVLAVVRAVPGVSAASLGNGGEEIDATLEAPEESLAAAQVVDRIRDAVRAVPGADALVGGQPAIQAEIRAAAERDRVVIIPVVLVVVFLVLTLLLRALLLPLLLVASVVLSYFATLGVGALVFAGSDPSVPLYAFVFLVTLGVDYNIFLMTRVREEASQFGIRAGTLRALSVTGSVITSAGVVLAATFIALSVLPILFMVQIAFLVAFGVLLDALVVRSLLVPALTVHIGRIGWWPGRLGRVPR